MEANRQSSIENETDSISDHYNAIRQIELEGYEIGVRKARNSLYWTGALVFAGEMIAMYAAGAGFNIMILIIALFESGVFVALALWTKKKPYTAIVSGLGAFIGILVLSAVANTYQNGGEGFLTSVFSGLLVKVIILANLIKSINDAKTLQAARKEKL
jgi:hypothetical protein